MSGSCGGCAGAVVTRQRDRSRRLSVGISSTSVSRLSQASLAAGRRSGVSIAVPDLHAAPVPSTALPVGRHARCCAHGSWLVLAPFRFFSFTAVSMSCTLTAAKKDSQANTPTVSGHAVARAALVMRALNTLPVGASIAALAISVLLLR